MRTGPVLFEKKHIDARKRVLKEDEGKEAGGFEKQIKKYASSLNTIDGFRAATHTRLCVFSYFCVDPNLFFLLP